MTALLVVLIVVVSRMPQGNPLKRLLTALCYRIGATMAAGLFAIPMEPIPGVDVIYDVAVPVALLWYWLALFREVSKTKSPMSLPKRQRYWSPQVNEINHHRDP
jgi:hypothetical protein